MEIRKVLALCVSASVAAAPFGAIAADRVSAPVNEAEELRGSPMIMVLVAAIVAGLIVILMNGDDQPTSP
jgi:hypothetical protein